MTTYYWDFYGPRAEKTAQHFVVHLNEFLHKHELAGCETGHTSPQPGHVAAWCKAPADCAHTIRDALRPKRSEVSETRRADGAAGGPTTL